MKKYLAVLLLGISSLSFSQTVQTTPNLITSGTTHSWYGVTTGTVPSDYMPSNSTSAPRYDPATNTVTFSYGSASIGQTYAVNQALASVGAGVKINGYTYSYDVRNMNGDDRQSGIDTFTVSQLLRGPSNSVLLSSSQYHNTKFDWKTVTGTKTATTPYNIEDTSYIQFGVQGADNGFWGGYFGPQIRNVDMRLNYTVDPCVTNPAYSPSCPGFNTVTTQNVFTGMSGQQIYAVNQALQGSGVMVHGFDYGYQYQVAGRYCNWMDFLGACLGSWVYPSASVNTIVTDNNNQQIWNENNNHAAGTSGNYSKQLRFGASRPIATMGSFSMTPTGNITNMFSDIVYTADPCVVNPLSSTSCPNYQQAYHDQQCSMNPLYAVDCPGYAAAYQIQQCSANPLYNQSCSGYAVAYHDQQCSANPLYMSDCPGYTQAYHDQQCTANPLYATDCSGYTVAYHDQQCSLNTLYASDCPGYQVAYKAQQCSLSPLFATDCPGYDQAYLNQQCLRDSLYSKQCEGYATAYAIKYLVKLNPAVTTAVNQQLTTNVEVQKADPANVSTTGDTTTDAVLAKPESTSATSTTSVTSVIAPKENAATSNTTQTANSPPPANSAKQEENKQEQKKADSQMAAMEKKSGGNREEAKKQATEKAKGLADDVAKAKTIEQQQAVQGQLVGVMNYVPGFSAYNNALVPDVNALKMARQYEKAVVDNRNAQKRMSGASDRVWQEMVDSQYQIGK